LTTIFTIGYEGHTPESFVAKLLRNRVEALVDIRELPISRKKGFSKSALAELLATHGIRYVHMKRLGSPSQIRHDLYHTGQREQFFIEFSRYLEGEIDALQEVSKLSREARICLMCVEQMPEACHRHLVADALQATTRQEVVIQHI
jgi:uncharacterized protein (DUF488 family)